MTMKRTITPSGKEIFEEIDSDYAEKIRLAELVRHHQLRLNKYSAKPMSDSATDKRSKIVKATFDFYNHKTNKPDTIGIKYVKFAGENHYTKSLTGGTNAISHRQSPATRELNELKGRLTNELTSKNRIRDARAQNMSNDGFGARINHNQLAFSPNFEQFIKNHEGEWIKGHVTKEGFKKHKAYVKDYKEKHGPLSVPPESLQLIALGLSHNDFRWVSTVANKQKTLLLDILINEHNMRTMTWPHLHYQSTNDRVAANDKRVTAMWIAQHPAKPTVDVKVNINTNPHLGSRSIKDMAAANAKRLAAITTTKNRLNLRDTLQATKSNRQNLLIGIGIGALALGGAYAIHRYRSAPATKQALLSKVEVGKRISEGLKKSNKIKHK